MKKNNYLIFLLIILNCLLLIPVLSYRFHFYRVKVDAGKKALIDYQGPIKPTILNRDNFPTLDSRSYILIDIVTNTILAQKNSNEKIYPASTTKLATALTALNIYPLDEIITIPSAYTEGKVMELVAGEKITVRSLVQALLVYSANDAAYNLALHHQNGVSGFVGDMNKLMKKYNINNTNFTNFDGIHNPSHYSTASDLAQLGRLAIKNPIITEIVPQKEFTVTDIDNTYKHELVSTNELLGVVPEIQGLKTGWTPEAGGCFISLINLNGNKLISVVTQSQDRFTDTKRIVDWAKNSVIW